MGGGIAKQESQTTNLRAGGSNPSGRASFPIMPILAGPSSRGVLLGGLGLGGGRVPRGIDDGAPLTTAGDAGAPQPLGYVPAVDGLRAVAVLCVVAFHLAPRLLPGGLAGVDLFFVISGFVVTSATLGRRWEGAGELFIGFYARRIVRIVPALFACLAATWILTVLFVPQRGFFWSGPPTGLAAVAGISNIELAMAPIDYVAPQSSLNPFLHTWSLGVEEQFYLLFPFLLWIAARRSARATLPWAPLAAVSAAAVVSFGLYALLSSRDPKAAFYLMPARFWELGAGAILFLSLPLWLARLRRVGAATSFAGWALSLLAFGWFVARLPGTHFHIPPLVLPVAGAAGMIALASARPQSLAARLLASPLPLAVGRRSYSLYLWHWPVLVLMRWTFGLDTPLKLAAALLAMLLATFVSYRFVERPIRSAFRRGRFSRPAVFVGAPAVAVVGVAGAWLLMAFQPQLSPVTDVGQRLVLQPGACVRSEPQPGIAGGEAYGWRGCGGDRATLFIVGDSHANAYAPMAMLYAARTGRRAILLFAYNCEFPPITLSAARRASCARFHEAAVRRVAASATASDVIFLASRHMHREVDPPLSEAERRSNLDASLGPLRLLAATGASLLLEAPKPVFPTAHYRCADWFNRPSPVCRGGYEVQAASFVAARAPALDDLRRLASALPRASIWDPAPILCPGTRCAATRDGTWLLRDEEHLLPAASVLLFPSFLAAAERR
jgi:peptidoglycan/LPS O-acetylase OafA/YrhL